MEIVMVVLYLTIII